MFMGGASGGPVFDSSGKVFAVNSTGFEDDNVSHITPIHTIENLWLEDVNIPSNSTGKVRVQELIDNSFISYD
jgi:S1-C subfamily serine protease